MKESCPLSLSLSPFLPAQAPKVVKVFINLPRSMGFDDAERSEATQLLELADEDCKEDGLIPLRYVKFQNVQSVTVSTRPTEERESLGPPWTTRFG